MDFKKNELIQEINVLGPWVHGYFDLGNDVIIEDQDNLQKKRLFAMRDYLIDIIIKYYKTNNLQDKTLCDVGCNTGYFLYEIYKKVKLKKVTGVEPRTKNLAKAKFIANFFKLPKNKFTLKKMDILSLGKKIEQFDIVIMPGVLHHLDDHVLALRNLYKMTKDLCVIETVVLSNEFNEKSVAEQLELKDDLYKIKENENKFGIIGYKLETDRLDGATIHNGIVGIPTTDALLLTLKSIGFDKVQVYRSDEQLRKDVYNEKSYRKYHSVIVVASKNKKIRKSLSIKNTLDFIEKNEFVNYIPLKYIEPLYNFIINHSNKKLGKIPLLMYQSELKYRELSGKQATQKLKKIMEKKPYYQTICTFKHAPNDKITFEYAKSLYHEGLKDKAQVIIENLIQKVNLDWRTVYKSYYLLAKIRMEKKDYRKAQKFNVLSLRAHPNYSLAIKLQNKLKIYSKNHK